MKLRSRLGATATITVAMTVAVGLFLLRDSGPDGPRVVVGQVGDFASGSVTAMDLDVLLADPVPRISELADNGRALVPIFIVNDPEGGLLALYAFGPHLGCRVLLASEFPSDMGQPLSEEVAFVNPCHLERYDLGGAYLAGPSPRGLDRFTVVIGERPAERQRACEDRNHWEDRCSDRQND